MEKKKKSRRASPKPMKKKRPVKQPSPKIISDSTEDADDGTGLITNVKQVIQRMKIHGIDGTDPPDLKKYLELRSKRLAKYKLKVPNLEVRYERITKFEPIFDMIEDARKTLQHFIVQEIVGENVGHLPYHGGNFEDRPLTFSDLSKVILIDNGAEGWSVKLVFKSDLRRELDTTDVLQRRKVVLSRQYAEALAGKILGSLLYEGELQSPEYGWGQRLFLYGSFSVLVGRDVAEATRALETEELNEFFSLDTLNNWYRTFGERIGVEINEQALDSLNEYDNLLMHIMGGLALRHGKRIWPFQY